MRLLHGSNVAVKKPDLKWCQSKNDFGRGFYLTPSWSRAWERGKRRKNIKHCFCTEKALTELTTL